MHRELGSGLLKTKKNMVKAQKLKGGKRIMSLRTLRLGESTVVHKLDPLRGSALDTKLFL